jgi:hypothetical protein
MTHAYFPPVEGPRVDDPSCANFFRPAANDLRVYYTLALTGEKFSYPAQKIKAIKRRKNLGQAHSYTVLVLPGIEEDIEVSVLESLEEILKQTKGEPPENLIEQWKTEICDEIRETVPERLKPRLDLYRLEKETISARFYEEKEKSDQIKRDLTKEKKTIEEELKATWRGRLVSHLEKKRIQRTGMLEAKNFFRLAALISPSMLALHDKSVAITNSLTANREEFDNLRKKSNEDDKKLERRAGKDFDELKMQAERPQLSHEYDRRLSERIGDYKFKHAAPSHVYFKETQLGYFTNIHHLASGEPDPERINDLSQVGYRL